MQKNRQVRDDGLHDDISVMNGLELGELRPMELEDVGSQLILCAR